MSDVEATAAGMRRAVQAVRREGYKVALVYAVVDAALATLFVNLGIRLFVTDAELAAVPVVDATLVPIVAGVAAGVVAFVAEFVYRIRRPLVEQFESANPEVREALRTARDAAADGAETRMARALYEDVLGRLRNASSVGLIDIRRVSLTVVVVLLLSVASVQVAVTGLDLRDFGNDGGANAPAGSPSNDFDGLQDGNQILGDSENVSSGDDELNASVASSGNGNASSSPGAYDNGGFASPGGSVESQQAGYTGSEQLEDAELIREYNLKIRDRDESNE